MVRFLILTTLFLCSVADAAMRHLVRPLEHQTRILSRGLSNVLKSDVFNLTPSSRYDLFTSIPSRYAVLVQCPKDEGCFPQFTGLCKAALINSEQNVKKVRQLTYEGGAEFTRVDVDSAVRPVIPNLPGIKTAEDIIKAAMFIQKYANYMTVDFLITQAVLGEYVNEHRLALTYEPAKLLDLVRPGKPLLIKERVAVRAEKALQEPREEENQLILLFCSKALNLAFNRFERESWKNWYPANKDHIDAVLRFAKEIYKDTPDIEAYKTEEEFNAALMKVDPEFAPLVLRK